MADWGRPRAAIYWLRSLGHDLVQARGGWRLGHVRAAITDGHGKARLKALARAYVHMLLERITERITRGKQISAPSPIACDWGIGYCGITHTPVAHVRWWLNINS